MLLILSCTDLPEGPAISSPDDIRGMTLVDWSRWGYGGSKAAASIQAIQETGASHLVVVVTAYQSSENSNTIRSDRHKTPSRQSVINAFERARELGLEIVIKPHVMLDNGTLGRYIVPSDPDAWFLSYKTFLLDWLALAINYDTRLFVIGTELAGTLQFSPQWQQLIRDVRAEFDGQLVYAASWDEIDQVPFWQQMDYLGIDAYFPVSKRHDSGRFEILAGWQQWLPAIERLHKNNSKPVLFTEIGYRSIDGAGMAPFDYRTWDAIDLQEQADLYWAALNVVAQHSWIDGIFWWNWHADGSGGASNTDYTPFDKPAENELRHAWGTQ